MPTQLQMNQGHGSGFVLCLHQGSGGVSESAACGGSAYASQACYYEEVRPQLLKMDRATPVCPWWGDAASTGEGNPGQRSLKADVHGIAWGACS